MRTSACFQGWPLYRGLSLSVFLFSSDSWVCNKFSQALVGHASCKYLFLSVFFLTRYEFSYLFHSSNFFLILASFDRLLSKILFWISSHFFDKFAIYNEHRSQLVYSLCSGRLSFLPEWFRKVGIFMLSAWYLLDVLCYLYFDFYLCKIQWVLYSGW